MPAEIDGNRKPPLRIRLDERWRFTSRRGSPPGFNNNVYWHTGHLVTVQASLLYGRAGESLPIDERFRKYFAKGTSPKDFDKARPTFDLIHKLLETMIDRTAGDLEWLYQLTYPEPVTVTSGKILKSSADAMRFLPIHEGIHLGMLSSMLKFL